MADVHVASFFSIHRPISVSTTVPPPSTPEAFDAIFSKSSTKPETEDVILTLSSAVDTMENTAHQLDADDSAALPRGSLNNAFEKDGSQADGINLADLKVSVEELTRHLRPFQAPPAPVPINESKEMTTGSEDNNHYPPNHHHNHNHNNDTMHSNSYSTVLTIHESTHADGRKTYEAHTTPFVRSEDMDAPGAVNNEAVIDDAPHASGTTYLERLRNNRTMHAISTKRRRKLKMKKHKYKKLLRRTRTLRRKLDKA